MLNLFMAMLLDAFDALSTTTEKTEEEDKISIFFREMKEKFKANVLEPIKARIKKLKSKKIIDDSKRFT
jgi:hypothetical protein